MKMKILSTIYRTVLAAVLLPVLFSCNAFLDEMPDNRTELDTPDKISQILVSAYSTLLPVTMQELMSDNVTDYGSDMDIYQSIFDQSYRLIDVTGEFFDSPSEVWNRTYQAIAAANHALEAIEKLGGGEDLDPFKGEALLCRAYGHFILVNTFCQAYNSATSTVDLGVPYATEPETTVFVDYQRGSVADVYSHIAADIEEGYPLIDDTVYDQVKFHFNSAAAASFAAQFFLYYGDYDKAVAYATDAIGEDPTGLFRDWSLYTGTSATEYANAFVSTEESANFMLQTSNSLFFRYLNGRYFPTQQLMQSAILTSSPWGAGSNMPYVYILYGYGNRSFFTPKFTENFVYSDIVAGIGQPYNIFVVFSSEKTMIDRAEANALKGDFQAAAADLNHFYHSLGSTLTLSDDQIADYYADNEYNTLPLAPAGLTLDDKTANMVRACLHARRIMTVHEGTRLQDLKRYGISYTHALDGEAPVEVTPYDKRLAIQLPNTVVAAGLAENPR